MYEYAASVLSVHDADTIRIDLDLGCSVHNVNLDVRLAGVDAPELRRPDQLGERAREALGAWLVAHPGPYRVTTIKDRTEKYGRYLVGFVIAPDGHELLADLTAAGWLKPYTGQGPKPIWP